jgi:hypothetical protein
VTENDIHTILNNNTSNNPKKVDQKNTRNNIPNTPSPLLPTIPIFTGIGVEMVNPTSSQHLRLTSLSGGQSSQIAIALLLATQRVVGVPFCILDEPDANMDLEFTKNLLNCLYLHSHHYDVDNNSANTFDKKANTPTQTILTSFHTEMAVNHANMIFQVSLYLGEPKITNVVGLPLPDRNVTNKHDGRRPQRQNFGKKNPNGTNFGANLMDQNFEPNLRKKKNI